MKIITNDGVSTDQTILVTAWLNPKFNKGAKLEGLLKDAAGKVEVQTMRLNKNADGKVASVSFVIAQAK